MHNSSPYHLFTSDEWKAHSKTLLTPTKEKINGLCSFNKMIDVDEVCKIYLSLSNLLLINIESTKITCHQYNKFLNLKADIKIPFVIGITGSVAVGKSTISRILDVLLQHQSTNLKIALITTDGFLFPNAILTKKNLMHRKGFPESYDVGKLLTFLSDIKSGEKEVFTPCYSHSKYDILEGKFDKITQPDVLIVEGINVLQHHPLSENKKITSIASDFLDFSIYIDADKDFIRQWYIERFIKLRETALLDPNSYFHRFAKISKDQSQKIAEKIWEDVNLPNLEQNILPTRRRADLVLNKGKNHFVKTVEIRKL
ncbi:Pantothenate kinase [Candidatus Liberibacter solanacearum]|uniref:type I pantothenate kinase n=1 Tax=Candidatus Liberibacter solanacearum TaxID=556287 RepID=UPI0038718606